jgi:microcin C transport system permease protein
VGAYLLKRILLIFPTLFGIMLISFAIIQFAPGGPIERIIAQVSGTDVSATQRIGGGGSDSVRGTDATGQAAGGDVTSKYRGAQGLDPEFIKDLEAPVRLR